MRRNWWIALVATLVVGVAPAEAASEPSVERADLVTHVFPETGNRVVAVALRYDGPVRVRSASPDAFTVTATVDGVSAPRTVTGVRGSGRTLILTLDPADANAGVNGNSADGATSPRDLRGAYLIEQTADVRGIDSLATGLENDGIETPVRAAFDAEGVDIVAMTAQTLRFFGFDGRTDDYWFRKYGVATVHFSTGMHRDYHESTDTVDRLKPDQILRVARVSLRVLLSLGALELR